MDQLDTISEYMNGYVSEKLRQKKWGFDKCISFLMQLRLCDKNSFDQLLPPTDREYFALEAFKEGAWSRDEVEDYLIKVKLLDLNIKGKLN